MSPHARSAAFALLLVSSLALSQQDTRDINSSPSNDQYMAGTDWQPRSSVPGGKTFEFSFDHSNVFPGTSRSITVYVPAQYTADKPACVYVGLDAIGIQLPAIFDDLIDKHEMPITIAIGLSPGAVDSAYPPRNLSLIHI